MATTPDAHLTVRQAAAQVPCGAKRIYTAIQNRELPAIRLDPQSIRIRQSDLDAWLATLTTGPAAKRRELLDPETIAFLSELATDAKDLTEQQKDIIRAAVRGES